MSRAAPSHGANSDVNRDRVWTRHLQGVHSADIARSFGVSRRLVSQIIQDRREAEDAAVAMDASNGRTKS